MPTLIRNRETDLVEAVEALISSDWISTACDETRSEIYRLRPRTKVEGDHVRSVCIDVDDDGERALAALVYKFGTPHELTNVHRRVDIWHREGREVRLESNTRGNSSVFID
ncbi:hypothetical protein [Propionibacterium sp.]|uniref:hypothetical protein n=1 Tax=Propionibacterium sp. TaxID=1977903 RepID=UPI0039E92A41